MKYLFLGLAPVAFVAASFWLAFSSIGGWGWFLFGGILSSILLYSSIENECSCGCGCCKSSDEEGCGENCTCGNN